MRMIQKYSSVSIDSVFCIIYSHSVSICFFLPKMNRRTHHVPNAIHGSEQY